MKKLNLLAYPLVAVLSLAAAGVALADDITPDDSATHVFAVPKTRAQVRDELTAARADGSIKVYSNTYNPLTGLKASSRARDAVGSAGHANAWYGEDSGSFALSRTPRAQPAPALYAGAPKAVK